jgi:hypothetical protein
MPPTREEEMTVLPNQDVILYLSDRRQQSLSCKD